MEKSIDFEKLLAKYIEHVGDCEGINFLNENKKKYGQDTTFTEIELDYLIKNFVFIPKI